MPAGLLVGVLVVSRGSRHLDRVLAAKLWTFGWPLIVTGILSLMMHQADRLVLRLFLSLHDLGIYSLAYQIGQGVNTLILFPFSAIWAVAIYDIAKRPDAEQVYAEVFRYFVYGLGLVMLAVSLAAPFLLRLLAAPEYYEAFELVPIICLAYFLFSLHSHFIVPALVAKKTIVLLPIYGVSALINVGLNLLLVPKVGMFGAAWVSVVTFGVFALCGLRRYRSIARYPYPLRESVGVVVTMVVIYVGCHSLRPATSQIVYAIVSFGAWTACAIVLVGSALRRVTARATAESVVGGASSE